MNNTKIEKLLEIMAALRDPETGCPWDIEQSFSSIAPYTIEEAYEVADAVARNDLNDLKDELGDLLLQVVFHARMAEEVRAFAFEDVVRSINEKMIRRHPHVFGDEAKRGDADLQLQRWEDIKADERSNKGKDAGALDGVALALPALQRAQKLGKRAARVGFDWPDVDGVREKLSEELDELERAISQQELEDEIGDILFTVAQLARHHGVDAETAARRASEKFERRFRQMEADSPELDALDPEGLERAWTRAKAKIDDIQ
ncbi:MAG: nucleoside triphosphate pyrophosphohydrolase [Pseudomonadota bacterium]